MSRQYKDMCALNEQETQTLKLYLAGLLYQDIAEKLHITRSNVSARINSIRQKLGVHNFEELRDKAIELRIIEPCSENEPQ